MELKDAIAQMAAQLKEVDSILLRASVLSDSTVPQQCYKTWQKRSRYHLYLAETLRLLQVRDDALKAMDRLNKEALDVTTPPDHEFRYCDSIVSFTSARFLTLQNYISSSWVVYDKLANVCARLIGPTSIGSNDTPARNAKLCSSFFPDKNADKKNESNDSDVEESRTGERKNVDRQNGFALHTILACQWNWPVRVSYKIRNLVVHEGMRWVGGGFFEGDHHSDGFKIREELKMYLDKECGKKSTEGRCSRDCLSRLANEDGFPWYEDDIMVILKKYNSEIDDLFSKLLLWCVPSFCSQVRLFSEPDNTLLALRMVNNS